ncbi:BspA family leucine-rich repeat surface protein [uncultured Ruminococcus sp.]|uniref:BspA family leucine-rich repeat surface protein n=1 Tax=uncultured Ruminococcus sp. TaxID=165186 RepID=UPI002603D815|nr:BspA family leucine-rich repeat surface protein [uncultured Ruminococcus sp.]
MERKLMQKTIAAIMAVALLGGAVTAPVGDKPLFSSIISANAEDTSTVSFNDATLTLTLSGEVVKSEVQQWANNSDVKKVVCEENTVLPADCTGLFSGFMAEEIDLSNADSSAVTSMITMFAGCSKLRAVNLSSLNTKKVTNMSGMFAGCTSLTKLDLSSFDTSNVTNMVNMFYGCKSLKEIDLSSFKTTKVTILAGMFQECESLKKLDLSSFYTFSAQSLSAMFFDCASLEYIYMPQFYTANATDMHSMFGNCSSLREIDLSRFNTSKVIDMSGMFSNCTSLTELDVKSFDTSKVESFTSMFSGCTSLEKLDVSSFDTSDAQSMSGMFAACMSLAKLDLSSFDTRNVKYMNSMFDNAALTSLNLGSFDTSNVTNMSAMFRGTAFTELDLSGLDTSNVTSMSCMFQTCSSLERLDLSGFNTSKLTDTISMFDGCESLKELDLSSFDTSKVVNMKRMFYSCSSLETVDLSSFDTSRVSEMTGMFYNCSSLEELDIGNFDTSKVYFMTDMFNGCSSLTKLDLTNFNTSRVDYMNYMFNDCTSLKELDVTSFEVPDNTYTQNNILTNCPAYNVTMEGAQLLLKKGLIGMQVAFTTNTDLKTVVIEGPAGEKRLDVSDLEKNADGKYVAPYYIDATQSRETITYSFYNKDGKKINLLNSNRQIVSRSSYSCTVNELIEKYISLYGGYDITAKEKTLAEKLLNFCNAAENYFCQGQYSVTELTMEEIADIKEKHSTDLPDDIKISLVLNSATSFRIYTDSKSVVFDDSTVKATPKKKDGKQYYELPDIPAQQLLTAHTVTIDGHKYTFTPMSYVWRVINKASTNQKLVDAASAAYLYGVAALDYVQQ